MYLFIALNAGVGNSYNAVSVGVPQNLTDVTKQKGSLGTPYVSNGICLVAYETFFSYIDIFTGMFGIWLIAQLHVVWTYSLSPSVSEVLPQQQTQLSGDSHLATDPNCPCLLSATSKTIRSQLNRYN